MPNSLPTYASLLVWGSLVFVLVAVVFILLGFKENRANLVSEETPWAVVASLAALGCAWLNILVEPLTALWIAFVIAVLAAWGAIMDHHRVTVARRPAAAAKKGKRP